MEDESTYENKKRTQKTMTNITLVGDALVDGNLKEGIERIMSYHRTNIQQQTKNLSEDGMLRG